MDEGGRLIFLFLVDRKEGGWSKEEGWMREGVFFFLGGLKKEIFEFALEQNRSICLPMILQNRVTAFKQAQILCKPMA